jgi:hypothetical protein
MQSFSPRLKILLKCASVTIGTSIAAQFPTGRQSGEAIKPVERGSLVTLGQRGVIENGVYEVSDFALELEDGLADVKQFGGVFPENMHTQ